MKHPGLTIRRAMDYIVWRLVGERRVLRHPAVQAAFADEEQRRDLQRFEEGLNR